MVEADENKQEPPAKPSVPPEKPSSAPKIFIYLLALAGMGLAGIWGYRGFLRVKAWLGGFGTGAYWIAGLITGFIYYDAAHRIYERIKEKPAGGGKAASYLFFCLALLTANPLSLSLALWLYAASDPLATAAHWFFIGCAVAAGIVLVLERLFAKKKSKP